MKLFAIRDNLIPYFMTPFVAPSQAEAQAAVAAAVNAPDSQDAIAVSPSHFELWELATLHADGGVTPEKFLVVSCNSLRRANERAESLRAAYNERRSPGNGAAHSSYPPAASGTEPPTSALSAR